jgi:hypothetical protein
VTRARYIIAVIVFVAAVIDLGARIEGYRSTWFWVVPLTILIGTFATLMLYLKRPRDA